MEEIASLMQGFATALTPYNLALMLVGILLGVIIGVLPGLDGANGVTILLPLTFTMPPTSAIFTTGFMLMVGRENPFKAVAIGVAVPVIIFMMFERWFLVPLPKGPLESLLGLG